MSQSKFQVRRRMKAAETRPLDVGSYGRLETGEVGELETCSGWSKYIACGKRAVLTGGLCSACRQTMADYQAESDRLDAEERAFYAEMSDKYGSLEAFEYEMEQMSYLGRVTGLS